MFAYTADGTVSEQADFILENLPNLLIGFPGHRPGGLLMSVLLAAVGITIGFAVAVLIASALSARFRAIRWLAAGYVQVFRGVPLILLLLIVHQLLGGTSVLGLLSTPLLSAFIALVLYSSSYQADIIYAGLRAVPTNLVDDARLLGSARWHVFGHVKLPYSLRVMQPALTGQGITLFKDTSVVVILGVADLTTNARIALGSDVTNAPHWVATYLTVGLLYFAVAFGVSRLGRRGERRLHRADMVHSLAKLG